MEDWFQMDFTDAGWQRARVHASAATGGTSLNVDTLSFQLWPWDTLLHRWSCAMRRTIALGSQSAHVSASVALVGHKRERNPDAYM